MFLNILDNIGIIIKGLKDKGSPFSSGFDIKQLWSGIIYYLFADKCYS